MPPVDSGWLFAGTVCAYVVVLLGPGLAVGLATGLRGWALAGLAPLLGYAVLGLAGPWLAITGLPYTIATATACTLALTALILALRRAIRHTRFGTHETTPPPPTPWTRNAHIAVAACVTAAFALAATVLIAAAEGDMNAIFQRWDPVFHANGIRYITETGDGSLYGVSSVNRYGPAGSLFYPNAYHLTGSLAQQLTGATIPTVLNAITLPLAGIFALSMTALIRQCGGSAILAGSTALISAAVTSAIHESIANGLVPFALSVALTPLGALALHRYLTTPTLGNGTTLTLAATGLLAVHSSALFAAIGFATPLLIHHWRQPHTKPLADLTRLTPYALTTTLITTPHLLGALGRANGAYSYELQAAKRASDLPLSDSIEQLVLFSHELVEPQLTLAVLFFIGLLTIWRLDGLRWVAWSALIFGVFAVIVASFGKSGWVVAISQPWWNDKYRVFALTAIPMCLIAAHGLTQIQRLIVGPVLSRPSWIRSRPGGPLLARFVASVVAITVLVIATSGLYVAQNGARVAHAYHNRVEDKLGISREITVSSAEREAMHAMAELAAPGERVLNDRADGSVWLYALTGVKSVAGHFDDNIPPPDAAYLAAHFREYRTDPEVRAAVDRLNVHHVFVGSGLVWPALHRAPGLTDLDQADFLTEVYRNVDTVIYRITP